MLLHRSGVRPRPRRWWPASRAWPLAILAALTSLPACCVAGARATFPRPRPLRLEAVRLRLVATPEGEPAYLIWPAAAFERNLVEQGRYEGELEACPAWSPVAAEGV